MKRVLLTAWQAARSEWLAMPRTECSTRLRIEKLRARAKEETGIAEIVQWDEKLRLLHNKAAQLGLSYDDVLRSSYEPERELALERRLRLWWVPRAAGGTVLVASPICFSAMFCSLSVGTGVGLAVALPIVLWAQRVDRTDEYLAYAKKKYALDYLAERRKKN